MANAGEPLLGDFCWGGWETIVGNWWETLVRDGKYYWGGKYWWEVGVAKNGGRWGLGNGSYKTTKEKFTTKEK